MQCPDNPGDPDQAPLVAELQKLVNLERPVGSKSEINVIKTFLVYLMF